MLAERDIKLAVEQYLTIGEQQGKWLSFRLNSGVFIMGEGKSKRVIRGTKKGTSDFLVLKRYKTIVTSTSHYPDNRNVSLDRTIVQTGVFFIEVKTDKTKQNQAQIDFQKQVEALGFTYVVVRSVDEVISLLGE